MFPQGMFPNAMFPFEFFPKEGDTLESSKFVRYTENQNNAMLRKWGRTAVPEMTPGELRWCVAAEATGSGDEKKWARKIV